MSARYSWERGSTRRWRGIRARVLADNVRTNDGRCTLALPGVCTGLADTVHHTHGRSVTGDDPRYLQATCRACNLKVGDPTRQPSPQPRRVTQW